MFTVDICHGFFVFFFKQKTAYEMRISDWSSDVCSSDLMQFASGGYTITGDTEELVGPQATIRVGDGTTPGGDFTATIAAELTGASQQIGRASWRERVWQYV